MRRVFTIIVAAALVVVGCQKGDGSGGVEESTPSPYITVRADVTSTRSVSKSDFVADDKVSVWAWTEDGRTVVDGVTNGYDGSVWSPDTPMLWWDLTSKHNFLATYPTQEVADFTAHRYTLVGNGAAEDDLLVAVNRDGLSGNDEKTVDLSFKHMMSKVTISVSYRTQFETTPVVESVTITAGSEATIDLQNQTTLLSSDATLGEFQILETKASFDFEGVIVPQDIQYISIKLAGYEEPSVYNHGGVFTLEQGSNHAISLIMGKDKVELAEDLQVIPWDEDNVLDGGDADASL